MNTPALHPAARMRPVLLERLERQGAAHLGAALLLAGLAVYRRLHSGEVTYPAAIAGVLLVGFILASAVHDERRVWDAAMPVNPVRYARVHLVYGLVWTAFMLTVMIVLYAALFADPGHPGWFLLALFAWGLSCYLLASAAFLSSRRQGAMVVCSVVLGGLYMSLVLESRGTETFREMGALEALAWTAGPLALSAAAAYIAARFPARYPEPARWEAGHAPALQAAGPADRYARVPRQDPAPTLLDRPAPPAVLPRPRLIRRGAPARPSPTRTVFRRHLALLLRFSIVPALTLFVFAWMVLIVALAGPGQEGESRTVSYFVETMALRYVCAFIALSWTVLVWLGEHGPQREWNDTLPVGTAKRRILHLAAGSAWLIIFLAVAAAVPVGVAAVAGAPTDVPAWLWLELPITTLTLYLAATFVIFGLRVAWKVVFFVAFFLLSPSMGLLERQATVVAEGPGSNVANLLWLVLFAAVAAATVALDDWITKHGRPPTVREAGNFLHGLTGTRPVNPLRVHAER